MIALLFLLFFIIACLSIIPFKIIQVRDVIFFLLSIILIFVAGLRDSDVANDYGVYLNYWSYREIKEQVELSFVLLVNILKNDLGLSSVYLFIVYAILGVGTKMYAIKKLSINVFLAALIYLSHYYILHEMTQIRIGTATGFLLIALYFKLQKKYFGFAAFFILAVFFHYSAAIGIVILLLNNKNIKYFYYVIPLGYILYLLNSKLNISIPIPYFQDKIDVYNEMKKYGMNDSDKINVFNFVFLTRILILYFLFYKAKSISKYNENIYVYIKIYTLSLFSFLFLADIPAFSFRISELFGVVEIILFPLIVYAFRNKFLGTMIVISIALAFICIDIYYNNYIYN